MRAKTIVIARPMEDSADLAEAIAGHGYVPLIEPILSVEYTDREWPKVVEGSALIFTSSNGVRAFAKKTESRNYSVYTAGRNTADEARKFGFAKVESAGGLVEDLAELLLGPLRKELISPLYVRAEDISQDLRRILGADGFHIDEFVAYKANPAQNLSVNLLKGLDDRAIAGIMFFSARGGDIFSDLIEQYDRLNRLRTTKALCISDAVVKSVSVLPFQQTLVADNPDRYGMIKLLEKISVSED